MKKYIMILVSVIMIMGLTGCEKKDMSYTQISMEEADNQVIWLACTDLSA